MVDSSKTKNFAFASLSFLQMALRRPFVTLAFATLCVLVPSLLLGVGADHDLNVHYLRTDQFPRVLAGGEFYPRWLPEMRDGLGSPTFYFYPPLAYYVCAFVDFISFQMLPTQHALAFTFAILLFASGATMFLWLRKLSSSPLALAGAIGFIIAPY